jgi:hypothetical protein
VTRPGTRASGAARCRGGSLDATVCNRRGPQPSTSGWTAHGKPNNRSRRPPSSGSGAAPNVFMRAKRWPPWLNGRMSFRASSRETSERRRDRVGGLRSAGQSGRFVPCAGDVGAEADSVVDEPGWRRDEQARRRLDRGHVRRRKGDLPRPPGGSRRREDYHRHSDRQQEPVGNGQSRRPRVPVAEVAHSHAGLIVDGPLVLHAPAFLWGAITAGRTARRWCRR